MMDEPAAALGMVLDEGRGSLPYRLIHGEALVTVASWALARAEIDQVDPRVTWDDLVEQEVPLVLHDPLCPMTPPEFLAACAETARDEGAVVVGVRPVTDTVKQVVDHQVGGEVDRTRLVGVCSPVVLPAAVVADLDALPSGDLVALVGLLRERYDVTLAEAPPSARRVADEEDLRVLAALTAAEPAGPAAERPAPGPPDR